jgi:hypothetical protein
MTKLAGSGSESGSISQRNGSADRIRTKMSWIRNSGRNAENYRIAYLFFVVSAELDDGADRSIILHVILADLPTKANL